MDCTPARELPEGRHLVRVFPQTVHAEVGSEEGCWSLPSGWYYTDTGRARIAAAIDVWQTRLDAMQAQIDASPARVVEAPSAHRETAPASGFLAGACLLLGFIAGRWHARNPHPK